MSSPRLLKKLGKQRAFRVLVLGQGGVGKTALTVRFITRRFIGEYDPTLEKKYRHATEIDEECVLFEILDTAGQEEAPVKMEENIKWADGFLLLYDICDVCSFAECTRLKFLIQYAKKPRRHNHAGVHAPLVFLVGNKADLQHDRMISSEEGRAKAETLACTAFHEISVRESCDDVFSVFHELYRQGRESRRPWLTRSASSRERTLSDDECSSPESNFLTPEDANKDAKRKRSMSQRLMRKVLPSAWTKQDGTHLTTGEEGPSASPS